MRFDARRFLFGPTVLSPVYVRGETAEELEVIGAIMPVRLEGAQW